VAGLAGATAVTGLAVRRRRVLPPDGAPEDLLGSLRTPGRAVIAEDGVPLHVEVDEPAQPRAGAPTLVFVHGWALTLDSWHFQRAAFRDGNRTVLYDQRSHGRSGRSESSHCTLEQLGRDLATVIENVAPEGPLVLVGHSMAA